MWSNNWREGGGIPHRFIEVLCHNFYLNSPKMASNEIWQIYSSIKTLKTILWFNFFSKFGTKVTSSDQARLLASRIKKFLTIHDFWSIWTIYTSNESWNYLKFIFGIEKYCFIKRNLQILNFFKFLIARISRDPKFPFVLTFLLKPYWKFLKFMVNS